MFWVELVHEEAAGKIAAFSAVRDLIFLGTEIYLTFTMKGMSFAGVASKTVWSPLLRIIETVSTVISARRSKFNVQFIHHKTIS